MAEGLHVGSASVEIVPDASGFPEKLRAKLANLHADVRIDLQDKAARAELDALARDRTVAVKVDDKGTIAKTDRRMHLLSTAIVGLAPAVAPFAAAIAGATAAAGGLGIAGILAVKGISDEMKAGTPLGLQYSAMLNGAKGDLTKLELVASSGILDGFDHALGDVEGAMPKLRTEIGFLAHSLGSDLGPITHGVLSLFNQMSPVMNELADGIHTVAVGFDRWSSGPGGAAFVAYIASVLPEIGDTLHDIGEAGAHVVDALLPLGGPVLKGIQGISTAIEHIPVSVIQDLFVAFTAYRTVTLATTAVQGFTKAMVALGIVERTAGAGAAAGAVGRAGVGGLIGRGAVAAGLGGVSLGTVGIVAGGVTAGVVAAQLLRSHDQNAESAAAAKITQGGPSAFAAAQARLNGLQSQLDQGTNGITPTSVRGGVATAAIQYGALSSKAVELRTELDLASKAMADASAANKAAGLTADGTRDAITGESVALAQLIATQDKAAAAGEGLVATQIKAKQAVADANGALKENGKTLDLNTQKGRDNQTALLNLGTALRAHIDAEAAVGKSTADVNAVLSRSEDKLIKVAEKFGLSKTKAKEYADQVLGLPPVAQVKFTTPGLAAALRGISQLNTLLESAYTLGGQAGAAAARANRGTFGASGVPNVVIPSTSTPSGPGLAPGKPTKKRAHGGAIFGPGSSTSDSILVAESNGEFTFQASAAKAIGYQNLARLNAMGAGATFSASGTGGNARAGLPAVQFLGNVGLSPADVAREITTRQQDVATMYALTGPV